MSTSHHLSRRERYLIVIALREKSRRQADIAASLSEPATPGPPGLAAAHARSAAEAERLAALILRADIDIWPHPKN
jgi:hypothetical protein